MNISKLILLQKDLDANINKNHPIGQNEDRVANKFNALVVELAEFANEGRWFKFWSEDRKPRTKVEKSCRACFGTGFDRYENGMFDYSTSCEGCHGNQVETHNLLLEEYIDSLHFFISIAIDEGWEKALYVPEHWLVELEESGYEGGLTEAFNGVIYNLMKSRYLSSESDFHMAYCLFITIGLTGFGFTDEVIEAAYMSKNKENHSRQQNGY